MCPNLNFSKKSFFILFPCKRTYKEIQYLHQPLPKAFTVSLGVDGGVVVSGGTRIVVVLGFAALSDITPARLSSRLSTPSETSIQIVDRPKLLRTDQNSSSTSSSSVVLFSISFRQQLPGVSSYPTLCSALRQTQNGLQIPFFALVGVIMSSKGFVSCVLLWVCYRLCCWPFLQDKHSHKQH